MLRCWHYARVRFNLCCIDSTDDSSKLAVSALCALYRLLDYSRSEMSKLRKNNADLRQDVSDLKEKNRRLSEFHNSLEAAVAVSNRRVVQMGRSNGALVSEVANQTKKVAALERELKGAQSRHEMDLLEAQEKYEIEVKSRELENVKLLKSFEKFKHAHKKVLSKLEKQRKSAEERHAYEVDQLKEEVRNTQEAYHDYLNKLMDVVENAHMAREAEETRLTEEFNVGLEAKDREIAKLRKDVLALKRAAQGCKAYI